MNSEINRRCFLGFENSRFLTYGLYHHRLTDIGVPLFKNGSAQLMLAVNKQQLV